MRTIILTILFTITVSAHAQKVENVIIITTDGFRWQEVFNGMDSSLANNNKFNQGDSANLYKKYWAANVNDRRKKLLPFFWSVIEKYGQIYGNRNLDNKVDNANRYWFSYPGYNEIFTGYPDTAVNSNEYKPNPNTNLLEFINKDPNYKNKIAAFGAWDAFDRIFNEKRSGFPVFSAFDHFGGDHPNATEKLINTLSKDTYKPFGEEECLDVFTHYAAFVFLQYKKPKVLYISYDQTDEWVHSGHYKDYLHAANQVDQWISELWNFIQHDPLYKNKTALFFTTDHGRGRADEWTSHNNTIKNSYEIWFAAMGPGIKARGELKNSSQLYQKQFAQTIAHLLGKKFSCEHPVGEAIDLNRD